jgi:hypothetical protein
MGQAVASQHHAVVPRSHFKRLRALLAAALIAVIGLTATVVILASQEDQASDTSGAQPTGHINYGGFNPAKGRPESAPLPQREAQSRTTTRYDSGPEEGTRGIRYSSAVSDSRVYVNPSTGYASTADEGSPEKGTSGPGASND